MNATSNSYTPQFYVPADQIHKELQKNMLVDGFEMALDLDASSGTYIVDAISGKRFLDFFTCFASMPIGLNHPAMLDAQFVEYSGLKSLNKPSNSDLYTEEMATFVKTFFELAAPKGFPYGFFIEGGALAVENALKAAFDWKVRKNFAKGYASERGRLIMHFKRAFHGRTGYTLSLTNTDPQKTKYFPQFTNWPRIHNPAARFPLTDENLAETIRQEELALQQMKQAFLDNQDDIAAIIIEPIQGEGGDNHFRPEFLQGMRTLADENEALLIFDEVQTGVGITGAMWVHELLGVTPDIMAFGKKMQVCGIVAGNRLDEVDDNVFRVSSRINSTWGGNLCDMIRATKYLEIIHRDKLVDNARTVGDYLIQTLHSLQAEHPDAISNVRGRGLFCAFDFTSTEARDAFQREAYNQGLVMIPSGETSMRFRPPLNLTRELVDTGMDIIRTALSSVKVNA